MIYNPPGSLSHNPNRRVVSVLWIYLQVLQAPFPNLILLLFPESSRDAENLNELVELGKRTVKVTRWLYKAPIAHTSLPLYPFISHILS